MAQTMGRFVNRMLDVTVLMLILIRWVCGLDGRVDFLEHDSYTYFHFPIVLFYRSMVSQIRFNISR